MSFLVLLLMAMGRKINLSDRIILKEALNQNSYNNITYLLKRIFKYTIIFELIGAVALSTVFVPQFGLGKGLFYSIFQRLHKYFN